MKLGFSTRVARRIAGDGKLGENDQLRVARSRFPRETEHEREVAREVADRGIDLPERNPHLHYLRICVDPENSGGAGGERFRMGRRFVRREGGGATQFCFPQAVAPVDGEIDFSIRKAEPILHGVVG